MSEPGDDQLPVVLSSAMTTALTKLPAAILSPAAHAIGRLLGGVIDLPVALVDGVRERIEDTNHERRLLRRALAEEAKVVAISDPALVQQTLVRLLNEQHLKDRNRKAIARATVEELTISSASTPITEEPRPVDNDWLDALFGHAERISGELLQKAWAKVLAREIVEPGGVSVRALSLLATMDAETLTSFSELARGAVGDFIPSEAMDAESGYFERVEVLAEYGLLKYDAPDRVMHLQGMSDTHVRRLSGKSTVVFWLFNHGNLDDGGGLRGARLTGAGLELAIAMRLPDEEHAVSKIGRYFDRLLSYSGSELLAGFWCRKDAAHRLILPIRHLFGDDSEPCRSRVTAAITQMDNYVARW